MFDGYEIYALTVGATIGCGLMDFPASLGEKSGRFPGWIPLQLIISAEGGIAAIAKFALLAMAIYLGFTNGVFVAFGVAMVVLGTDAFFRFLVNFASTPPIIGSALVANLAWLVIGPIILLHFAWGLSVTLGIV